MGNLRILRMRTRCPSCKKRHTRHKQTGPSPLAGEGGEHERSEMRAGRGGRGYRKKPLTRFLALRSKPPSPARGEGTCHRARVRREEAMTRESVTRPPSCASFPAQNKNKGNASVRLHHRRRRLGRLGPGQPAVRQERQQGAAAARPARTRRPARSRRRSSTAIPARPISIRASTGPSSRSPPRSSPTTIRTRTARRCANTSRRACWAAARRSTASSPIAARRPTTTNGRRAAPRAGTGTTCCPTSRRSSATSISTAPGTARTAASRCAAFPASTGPDTPGGGRGLQARRHDRILPDQNGEFDDGYFPITHSNAYEQRVSAAIGYLDRETRKRPNLTISTDTQVKELLFEGTRCVGVKAMVDGKEQEFRGNEVILSSGAIHSPAHLLRAGIGPVGHLRDLGIPVLMRRCAGVGQRLMDHPVDLAVVLHPPRRAHERAHAPPHPAGPALFLRPARRAQGRHVRRRRSASRPGMRSASRSARCSPSSTRPIPRPARSSSPRATGAPSRSSSSTCCPTGATSTG